MREICTSGSTRGEWVVLTLSIAHSPTLPSFAPKRLLGTKRTIGAGRRGWEPHREPQPVQNITLWDLWRSTLGSSSRL